MSVAGLWRSFKCRAGGLQPEAQALFPKGTNFYRNGTPPMQAQVKTPLLAGASQYNPLKGVPPRQGNRIAF